jgi:hypothetical protein
VRLLSAVAGKDESMQTTFNNDIREVLDCPRGDLWHSFHVCFLILHDLQRRRPEGDPDIQKKDEERLNILKKIQEADVDLD